ncbi:ABC transporter ATP-binding protein [Companilactobacillus mishanensis]|uniref:ABC transporter ATP-binding protein n=1 Tax=Companilactobacillus mishanensis TaxID=2486008 RepID=A0ABW9P8C3_9LACO|nr:ABC transporter ATP-binding protein [Companilactobacillus mishanensis]MQS45417.1 ABC transporter ATP-binding protein [Companilactobacillus mishanensis]
MTYYLKNLSQVKSKQKILDNINLEIPEDSIFAILGPSGSGKTTLLNILAQLDQPSSGEFIADDDNDPKGIMVFQDYRLFPHMTVFQNVTFGLRMNKVNKKEIKKRAQEILEVTNISELSKRYPDELSGGQQQRVALARALILNPKLLLMDEPFSSLDEGLRKEMLNFVKQLQQKFHLTIIFVTHYKTEAYLLSNRVGILLDGVIKQVDSPRDLEQSPNSIEVAKFLGQSNLISGEIDNDRFQSNVYSGPVETEQTEQGQLYLPYSGLVKIDETSYPAFVGKVLNKAWFGENEQVIIEVNGETIFLNLPTDSVEVDHNYPFYFKKIPKVF